MKIPEYIYDLLYKYGNAYMSPHLIRQLGGIDRVLKKLSLTGFECEVHTFTDKESDILKGRRKQVIESVIWVKGQRKENKNGIMD